MERQRSLLVAFSSLLFACGSVETAPTPPPPSTLVEACHHFFQARVAYEHTCPGFGPSAPDEASTVASCVGVASARGSLVQASEVESCAAQLGSLACVSHGGYPSCVGWGSDLLFPEHDHPGTLPPGEGCFAGVQCDSGYCSGWSNACGMCLRPRAVGESCPAPEDHCLDGSWCTDGSCQLPGTKEGEKCNAYGGGDCQQTLFCKTPDPSILDGVCAARGPVGAACDDVIPCAEGEFCDAGSCALRHHDGASCTTWDSCEHDCIDGVCGQGKIGIGAYGDCTFGDCGPDLHCENQICIPYQYLPKGAICTGAGPAYCGAGLICDLGCYPGPCAESSVCTEIPGPGETCSTYGNCAPGSACVGFSPVDGMLGACVKLGVLDQPCPCNEALTCVAGKCVAFSDAVCE